MRLYQKLVFVFVLSFTVQAFGQNFLRNPGFETWKGNLPEGWSTDTIATSVSTVSHSGSSALRLTHSSIFGIPFLGTLDQDSILVSGSSFSLKGWYQFHPQGGDRFMITIFVYGHPTNQIIGNLVGAGSKTFTEAANVYTAFSVGVSMVTGAEGDTASVTIYTLGDTTNDDFHEGTYALFDDLVLDNSVTDVRKTDEFLRPSTFALSQNYPNPFNPTTQIEFTVPKKSSVSLKIYNSMGQEVTTLVNREFQPGRYRAFFDGSGLASGVYFYKMIAGNFVQTNKMMLVK